MPFNPRRIQQLIAGGALVAAAITTTAHAMEDKMTEATTIESAYSFTDTLQRLRSALESKGLTIFAVIDQREAARSVGLDMPPTTLLVYGNPKGGTPLMLAAPDFGLELPLKVLVREDPARKTLVVYLSAKTLEGKHGLPAGLAEKLAGAEPLIAAAVSAGKSN
ncbi:DUF302 domain-containing protein [Methylobacterium sp. Leaf86]|uniref:DUF302 domain-containing protein n=1 Tax=Methylobacterium sp. Leaf86 TaxID=1736242 RepID=UPI0009EC3CB0|nr:DUF302 domain-containing protein [Methylobacterium sp. Leaf86]